MIVSIIILSCLLGAFIVLSVFEFFTIVGLTKMLETSKEFISNEENEIEKLKKEIKELNETKDNQEEVIDHLKNESISLKLSHLLNLLITYKLSYEEEKYSDLYNHLYFIGISREILDDIDKMSKFIEDIEGGKYLIQEGEKPFQFKFILKGEYDEKK